MRTCYQRRSRSGAVTGKLEYSHMRRLIIDELGGVDAKYRLGTGISGINLPPTYVLKLDWSEEQPVETVGEDDI